MTRTGAICALAWALSATALDAQVRVVRSGDDRLTGINAVDVLVTAGPAATPCDISTSDVQRRAVDALRAAQLEASVSDKARSSFYSVVIDIRSIYADATCAVAVTTELVAEVHGIPEADQYAPHGAWGSLLVGFMPLVHDTALVIGAPEAHDAAVRDTVQAHVTAIAARIRSINP